MNEPAVVLDGVTVSYGRHEALRNVSVEFPRGAIGLLGPNGAGKSTLIKALLGLLPPSSGRMRVLGYDISERYVAVAQRRVATATRTASTLDKSAEDHPHDSQPGATGRLA